MISPPETPGTRGPTEGLRTKFNTIILTSGLSGSSVLSGLIGRSGRWLGDSTMKKESYDTFENAELVRLNMDLIARTGNEGNYALRFSQELIAQAASFFGRIDDTPHRGFLEKCEKNEPWVWKDPRLWVTIRFWANLLPLDRCRFVVLTRDHRNSWIASILRRHIRSAASLARYESSITQSILDFLRERSLVHIHVTYEDLLMKPEATLERLNAFLPAELTLDDLRAIYRGPLYRIPHSSMLDHLKACLIYAKNYAKRYDKVESSDRRG